MTKAKFEKAIKEAYIAGWADREFKILRPTKEVKKILRKYSARKNGAQRFGACGSADNLQNV